MKQKNLKKSAKRLKIYTLEVYRKKSDNSGEYIFSKLEILSTEKLLNFILYKKFKSFFERDTSFVRLNVQKSYKKLNFK